MRPLVTGRCPTWHPTSPNQIAYREDSSYLKPSGFPTGETVHQPELPSDLRTPGARGPPPGLAAHGPPGSSPAGLRLARHRPPLRPIRHSALIGDSMAKSGWISRRTKVGDRRHSAVFERESGVA